ncbi:MAG: hypothetical protein ABFD29_03675 [Anaerolineaceae bacterium]
MRKYSSDSNYSTKLLTWSYWGGVQSVAIAALISLGKLPKPSIIVIADTGREAQETWEYTDKYVKPMLYDVGCKIELAPHSLSKVDLYSKSGDLLIPAFTSKGKLPTFCSVEWKRRVIRRYLRNKGVENCITWLGISGDEVERVKPSDVKWQEYGWPLLFSFDKPYSRKDCLDLVKDIGLPEPPKSSCWMCPHRNDDQWLRLKNNFPKDWEKAVQLDVEIRKRDSNNSLFLHRSRIPLSTIKFEKSDKYEDSSFSRECSTELCWI